MNPLIPARIASLVLAGLLGIMSAGAAVAQPRVVPPTPPMPPVPPAPPALVAAAPQAPVAPLPPLPPSPPTLQLDDFDFNFEFNFDKDAFKLRMDDFKKEMDAYKDTMKESVKESVRALQDAKPFPTPPNPPNVRVRVPDFAGPASDLYDSAHELINAGRYERALDQLNKLIAQYDNKPNATENRVDAALYWKAYVQLKEGNHPESLATLSDLQKRFGDSRWIRDARALEVEVRQASGQQVSPQGQSDEELKLLALRGLMQADPDRALPQIEQIMSGNSSVRLKENALFVLSQSRTTRARDIIASVAKSNSNPDVQLRAVRYLGSMRTPETRQVLDDVYRSTSDVTVKRVVIQSYASNDNVDRLADIAKNEKDVSLRRTAIRSLGGMRRTNTSEALKAAYLADSNVDVRKEVIRALGNNNNAVTLVELARQEKNAELKTSIVQQLGNMKSKEAADYLVELLK
jgi:HEAT repeat protein